MTISQRIDDEFPPSENVDTPSETQKYVADPIDVSDEEISEVKSELEEEGFTSDEAAKLIQNVYRKVSCAKSLLTSPCKEINEDYVETKSWDQAMGVMSSLMQVK